MQGCRAKQQPCGDKLNYMWQSFQLAPAQNTLNGYRFRLTVFLFSGKEIRLTFLGQWSTIRLSKTRGDTIRGREVEDRRKEVEMTAPISLLYHMPIEKVGKCLLCEQGDCDRERGMV